MVGETVMYKLEWRSIWYDRHPMAQRGVSMGQSLNLKQYQCDAPVPILVERFDIEPSSDFSSKWSNVLRLVLFCIDAKFCKKMFVGKLLARSTGFTCFWQICTAQTSIFQQNCVKLPRIFDKRLQKNIRWKALDEIYKIYMLLHRSDLNISAKFRQSFLRFQR